MKNRISILLIFFIITPGLYATEIPKASGGVLDIREWDFEQHGNIALNGEWKFINGDHYTHGNQDMNSNNSDVVNVPGYWNHIFRNGKGTGWYLLDIYLPDNIGVDIGIYLKYAFTCYELYINGERILNRGIVNASTGNIPQFLPALLKINHNQKMLKIAWKVSNYHDAKGGAFYPVILGTYENIQRMHNRRNLIDYFQLFFVFTIFLFHLSLWFSRKKEKDYLIFSLCALSIFIRTAGVNNLLTSIIASPNLFIYTLEVKMVYLGGILAGFLFPLFFDQYYKLKFARIMTIIFLCLSGILGLLLLFSDNYFFSSINTVLQIIAMLCVVWIIILNIISVKKKLPGAKVFLLGMVVFFITAINDTIFSYVFLATSNLLPFGFMAFIFSMSTVLILKLTKLLRNEEYLTFNLKNEVKKRTAELEEMTKQKTEFFINLAHETKTPLTLVSNYLDKYIKEHEKNDDLFILKENISKLKNDMVNYLDTDKIERNQIFYDHEQICDFSQLISDKNIIFKETAFRKSIDLKWDVEEEIYIKADPVAVDRVLNNLLDNAVKYTETEGEICVSLKQKEGQIILTVADTGIGISEIQKDNIFSPHYQLSHKKRNIQGFGLGLHITSLIIKELGGSIHVESELGKGTTFTVFLYKHDLQAGEEITTDFELSKPSGNITIDSEALEEKEHNRAKRTICIVEDNIQMVAGLKHALEEEYNVYYAVDGNDALSKLNSHPVPDIIISDIMMDVMDGYEFRKELIKDEMYKAIPFIFLTAKGSKDDRMLGLSQGAADYICKPFDVQELKEKIKNWLLLVELKNIRGEIELKAEHQKRLECFFKDFNISKREKDIISFLLEQDANSNKEIGETLFIAETTVKKHIERIKEKLNVRKKCELLNFLYEYIYK